MACVGEEAVGAEGVFVIVGNLGFKRSDFLLKLLICARECVGFKAMDGVPMLDGGNEPSRNVSGLFGGEVLGENVDCCLRGDGQRDS